MKPDPYYWGKNPPTPLNLPQSVLDEIDAMGKEFAELHRVRLGYRRMVRDDLLKVVGGR